MKHQQTSEVPAAHHQADWIPFNHPTVTGLELELVNRVFRLRKFAAGGQFSRESSNWLSEHFSTSGAFLTSSGTDALEMAALLCELEPGDEVILPSYAFSTTATAFARCGASLVFVDVDPTTMNIDPAAAEAAITPRTRVIVALHYAGISCDMEKLEILAGKHDLVIVEDAAQAMFSSYLGKPCGTYGRFGCISFHESKNIQCGEGGALICNEPRDVERAEVILEKGTNRNQFFRGEVNKYTWLDMGSSFVMSELNAAFLLAQLEHGLTITQDRLATWRAYHAALRSHADQGILEICQSSEDTQHNGHMFWIKARDLQERTALIAFLKKRRIHSVFHYQPLHSAPAGKRFGRFAGQDLYTTRDSERILRLPLYYSFGHVSRVVDSVRAFYGLG